jgi:hypothetical protein
MSTTKTEREDLLRFIRKRESSFGRNSDARPMVVHGVTGLLAANQIHLPSTAPGRYYTVCPRCSAKRTKPHQRSKVLGVTINGDGAHWGCNHCGWTGPAKGDGASGSAENLATYDYVDEHGKLLFQKVRAYPAYPKKFWLRRPDGNGWIKGRGSARKVIYRLPEVLEAIATGYAVAVVEGEKDADNLWRIGIPATCSPDGASEPDKQPKWRAEYSEMLRGADIVIMGDNDAAGHAHIEATAAMSAGITARVRVLDLAQHWPEMPQGGDISDWLAAGHTREQLDALIETEAKPWAPQEPPAKEPPPSANDGAAFGYSWHLDWHGENSSASARKWLVLDLLPETGVALISGQWGTYKTFVADDLSAALMTATPFANKQVTRKGGVLFLACEGQNEVNIRLTAAFRKRGGTGNAPFAWAQSCPRLLDPNAGKILAAMVQHAAVKMMQDFGLPVAMAVIDTAGKAAGLSKPGDLNDDAVAKTIMRALAEASIQTGALFVGVAHFGKNVETGTKGSSGFEDDADIVLALIGERGTNGVVTNPVLCVRKRRSGPNGEELPFQTEEADVPNEEGGSEKTLTIRWTGGTAATKPKQKDDPWAMKSLRHLRQTMMNILADCGSQQRPYPDGPMVRAVDLDVVRVEFHKGYPATGDEAAKKEARKKAFNRAIETAHDKRLIGSRDIGATTFVWLAAPSPSSAAAAHEAGG